MYETVTFGQWLKRWRRTLDLTQSQLARQVGCAVVTIQKIETDERRPSKEIAARLATVLDVPAAHQAAFLRVARAELGMDHLLEVIPRPPLAQPAAIGRPPARVPDEHRHNLPAPFTSFIGREQEAQAVISLLQRDDVRLLTLTGVGGVGKTRLALEVARTVLEDFADGVWFVDLAPINTPALVVTSIAQVMGLMTSDEKPLGEHLTGYLRAKQLLLVLDNFEQVIDAAPLLTRLLQGAPEVSVLVTSRRVLHLYGEHEIAVPALALPDSDRQPDLAALARNEAVALFVARAQAVKPSFRLADEYVPVVAEICRRLDGLPLAIELAAARSKLLAPSALLARLAQPLHFLAGGPRDIPTRQQTLRATIDWSHGLLGAAEQTLFRRLSIFVGGWTVEAAVAICGDSGEGVVDVPEALEMLVDNSLIRYQDESGGSGRFTMLETVRAYARERLEASGEAEVMRRQHAVYFCTLAERAEPELRGTRARAWLERMEAEYDNLYVVLRRSQVIADGTELGMRLVGAIFRFWDRQGRRRVVREWLHTTLAAPQATGSSTARARALDAAGHLAVNAGDHELASRLLREGLALAQQLGDQRLEARMVWNLGTLAGFRGERAGATALLEESLTLFRAVGDQPGAADVLNDMALHERDLERAEALSTESYTVARGAGDALAAATALGNVAWVVLAQGDVPRAAAIMHDLWESVDDATEPQLRSYLLRGMAEIALAQGELKQAAIIYDEALELFRKHDETYGIANSLQTLGRIALWQGDHARAMTHLAEGLAVIGTRFPTHRARLLVALGEATGASGDLARAKRYFAEGLDLFHSVRDSEGAAWALRNLGDVALQCHEVERSRAMLRESLQQFHTLQDTYGMLGCVLSLAELAEQQGCQVRAARLWGMANALLDTHPPNPQRRACRPDQAARTHAARERLSNIGFEDAWAAGRAMPVDQAVTYALAEAV